MDIEQFEKQICGQEMEHLGIFDHAGQIVYDVTPEYTASEGFNPYAECALKQNIFVPPGSTLTHNHPDGSPPSYQDLVCAKMLNLSELRVAHPFSGGWSVRRPAGGWVIDEHLWYLFHCNYQTARQAAGLPYLFASNSCKVYNYSSILMFSQIMARMWVDNNLLQSFLPLLTVRH